MIGSLEKHITLFENHEGYEEFTASTAFCLHNVSFCEEEEEVHYDPKCESSVTYYVIDTSVPEEVAYSATSFNMTVNYSATTIDEHCSTSTTQGSETVVVAIEPNPTTDDRTVSGTIDFHGTSVEYSVQQEGKPKGIIVVDANGWDYLTDEDGKMTHCERTIDAPMPEVCGTFEMTGVQQLNITSTNTADGTAGNMTKIRLRYYTNGSSGSFSDVMWQGNGDVRSINLDPSITYNPVYICVFGNKILGDYDHYTGKLDITYVLGNE